MFRTVVAQRHECVYCDRASGGLGRRQTRVHPVALGTATGEVLLHVTALANVSSVLNPTSR